MKILIAEDCKEIRDIQELYLSELCQIDFAENGQIGYEKAKLGKYDLIITDVNMPVMGGIEMIEKLRDEKVTTPIFVFSGEIGIKSILEMSKVRHHIEKNMDELLDLVKEFKNEKAS